MKEFDGMHLKERNLRKIFNANKTESEKDDEFDYEKHLDPYEQQRSLFWRAM